MITSGQNSNLVLIQHKIKTSGTWNDAVAWVEERQVWVSISPNRGREVFSANELESVVTHTIRGDFLELDGVTATMRIVYNDTHEYDPIRTDSMVFDILGAMPNHDGRDDVMIQAHLDSRRYGDIPPDVPQ